MARKAITKKLTEDPEQYGTRLHSPLHGLFKLKSSHMRVAYHIEKDLREVWVLVIGDRRTIWKDRQGEILDRLKKEKAKRAPTANNPSHPAKCSQPRSGK